MGGNFEEHIEMLERCENDVARANCAYNVAKRIVADRCCPYTYGDIVPVMGNWAYSGRKIKVDSFMLERGNNKLHGNGWYWILNGRLISKMNGEAVLTTKATSYILVEEEDVGQPNAEESSEPSREGV